MDSFDTSVLDSSLMKVWFVMKVGDIRLFVPARFGRNFVGWICDPISMIRCMFNH